MSSYNILNILKFFLKVKNKKRFLLKIPEYYYFSNRKIIFPMYLFISFTSGKKLYSIIYIYCETLCYEYIYTAYIYYESLQMYQTNILNAYQIKSFLKLVKLARKERELPLGYNTISLYT